MIIRINALCMTENERDRYWWRYWRTNDAKRMLRDVRDIKVSIERPRMPELRLVGLANGSLVDVLV